MIQNNYYLDDAIAHWLDGDARSLKSYKTLIIHAAAIAPFTKNVLLENAVEAVTKYRNKFRKSLSPATINRRCAIVRRVCNLAYNEWEWLEHPVGQKIKMLPENNTKGMFLTVGQINEVVEKCNSDAVKDAILLAAYSGVRLGELMNLGKDNFKNGSLHLGKNTKSGKARTIPLPKQVHEIAKNLPIKATRHQVQWHSRQAFRACGIPARFHDLRHTFASLLLQAGANLTTVKQLMGHSTIAITVDLYGHLDESHLEDAIQLLEKRIG